MRTNIQEKLVIGQRVEGMNYIIIYSGFFFKVGLAAYCRFTTLFSSCQTLCGDNH